MLPAKLPAKLPAQAPYSTTLCAPSEPKPEDNNNAREASPSETLQNGPQ
jgi:hypothetical protein